MRTEGDGRPSFDQYFIGIAVAVAARGDCTRSQVGAVLVEDRTNRILSTGYNGVDPGRPGCLAGRCERGRRTYSEQPSGGDYSNCIAKHAEDNALTYWNHIDYYGGDTGDGPSIYITRPPCDNCIGLMLALRINRVVWIEKTIVYPASIFSETTYVLGEMIL